MQVSVVEESTVSGRGTTSAEFLQCAHHLGVGYIGHVRACCVVLGDFGFQVHHLFKGDSSAVGAHSNRADAGGVTDTGGLTGRTGAVQNCSVDGGVNAIGEIATDQLFNAGGGLKQSLAAVLGQGCQVLGAHCHLIKGGLSLRDCSGLR